MVGDRGPRAEGLWSSKKARAWAPGSRAEGPRVERPASSVSGLGHAREAVESPIVLVVMILMLITTTIIPGRGGSDDYYNDDYTCHYNSLWSS